MRTAKWILQQDMSKPCILDSGFNLALIGGYTFKWLPSGSVIGRAVEQLRKHCSSILGQHLIAGMEGYSIGCN